MRDILGLGGAKFASRVCRSQSSWIDEIMFGFRTNVHLLVVLVLHTLLELLDFNAQTGGLAQTARTARIMLE